MPLSESKTRIIGIDKITTAVSLFSEYLWRNAETRPAECIYNHEDYSVKRRNWLVSIEAIIVS